MPVIDPRSADDPANAMLIALVKTLDAHRVPYVFTGAFTLGFWSQPRSSKDIDVVVLLRDDRAQRKTLLDDLATAGFIVPSGALDDLQRVYAAPLGMALPSGGQIIVELLVPEPAREKLTRRIIDRAKVMPFPGLPNGMRVITPEDLIVYKLLLFRDGSRPLQTDDLKDIRDLVALRKDTLDFGYIELPLDVDESLSKTDMAKRRRWFDKTRVELGARRPGRPRKRS